VTGASNDAARVVLAVDRVEKVFGTGEDALRALAPTSLEVGAGEFVAVIGPSGCGKSTLFNIIGGLEPATAGEVRVDGHSVSGSHRDIGMVFQEESTFPWRSVLDNVAFGLEVAGMGRAERHDKARRLIRMVGLEGFERRLPAELSGGMRQRTAIARTLASEPRILLLDEPFASLDEQTRMLLGEQLIEICSALQQTTLLITHNISEAVQLSDRVAVMSFRPGTIKRMVDIDLPRPRTTDVIGSPAFGRYVQQIWEELKAEALRGMQAAAR
jgi:NitT/TauT family transport system ATP-binding protein